ncbi:MAG: hypothetical protein ACLFWD_04905 [Anaerolineales bacterium]
MTRSRQWLLVGIVLGLSAGLLYGWLLQPVEFVDTTPDSLRQDFKTDYVLMVAEAYQQEEDLAQAERRLARLGPQPPIEKIERALEFAENNRFSGSDIELLEALAAAFESRGGTPEISAP